MSANTDTSRVLIQPAAGDAARDHYQETIADPVPIARVRSFLSDEVLDQLTEHHPSGDLFVWGLTPGGGGRGRTQWEKISPGDVALFSWDGKFRSCGRVTVKAENADLARELWGTDDDGQTWQLLYFLTEPATCAVPYEEFNETVGYKLNYVPQGFAVLDEEKSRAVLDQLDVPIEEETPEWPTTWWVNQGATYSKHRDLGIVWAPQTGKGGRTFRHHLNVAELEPGDRILHYTNKEIRAVGEVTGEPTETETSPDDGRERWNEKGYRAPVEYRPLEEPVGRDSIPLEWRQDEGSPFTSGGELRQGYLFSLSAEFSQKLADRFPEIGQHFPPAPGGDPVPTANRDLATVCSDFSSKLRSAGLSFGSDHEAFVRDFVVSLATKQLVILTGLSGSGKTQIALQFGRWLSGGDEDRYRVVPVRPDWTGPEALLGYEDALRETEGGRRAWQVPAPLQFMLRAARDEDRPYLMILDEMNLAHVERYFADVISGMESGEGCLPNLREDEDGTWRKACGEREPDKIPFPDNLFIAGTVNVDETTYMFSPKVLDRANTLEFTVETEDLQADIRKPGDCEPGDPSLVRGFLEIASDENWHVENPPAGRESFVGRLKDLHRELDRGFSFGHRVLFEAIRYAALHAEAGGDSMEEALDVQVLQKILPRIHGSRRRVEPVLRTVGKFCWDLQPESQDDTGTGGFDPENPPSGDGGEPVLERSFDKVRRMTERLRANQFVSFTE